MYFILEHPIDLGRTTQPIIGIEKQICQPFLKRLGIASSPVESIVGHSLSWLQVFETSTEVGVIENRQKVFVRVQRQSSKIKPALF
jgi:hypothetical protein